MAQFTTIAAISSAALSTGMSFAQASKQRKLQQEAEREAQKAFDEAKAQLEVNYLEGLGVAKEPYELEREALIQAGAQALQAGVEGETRGAAATAGRVLMAQQEQAAQQRAAMSKEMQQLELLAAQEEARLQQQRTQLDIGEAVGQQQRAQEAQRLRQQAMGQAVGGLFDIAGTALESRGLFADEQADVNKQIRQLRRSPEYNLGQSRAALDLQLQQSIPTTSIFDPMAGLSALPVSTLPSLGQLKPR